MLETLTQLSEEESYPVLQALCSRLYNTHISTGLTVSFWFCLEIQISRVRRIHMSLNWQNCFPLQSATLLV